MSDVAEYGVTVLVSSHNLRELEDVCDHVGIMDHGKVILERSLDELQSSVCKIRVAFAEENPLLPKNLHVMNHTMAGRVHTLIVKEHPDVAREKLKSLQPLLLDVLPLTLEEIFIYELGGKDYAVKEILF